MVAKKNKISKMSDLARIAGVSKSTVSRALAGNELVNKATRDRIAALAKEYNYRINTQARNFRTKQSLTIGLLVSTINDADWQISDPFFLELIGSIAVNLNQHGHNLLLSSSRLSGDSDVDTFINENLCDGVIIIGQANIHEALNHLHDHLPTMVVWGAPAPDQRYITVGGDNVKGGYLATKHLLEQGCRNIVFMGDPTMLEEAHRFKGYTRALQEYDLEVNENLIVTPNHIDNGVVQATNTLLENGVKFDGIVTISDVFAMAVIKTLRNAGLRVPNDVLVVGYDDISMSEYFMPAISSIRQDRQLGAQLLVEKVLALVEGESAISSVLETSLITRSSSTRSH